MRIQPLPQVSHESNSPIEMILLSLLLRSILTSSCHRSILLLSAQPPVHPSATLSYLPAQPPVPLSSCTATAFVLRLSTCPSCTATAFLRYHDHFFPVCTATVFFRYHCHLFSLPVCTATAHFYLPARRLHSHPFLRTLTPAQPRALITYCLVLCSIQ